MQLRKLYRTIETIASEKLDKEEDLFKHVLHEIVQNEESKIKGGRYVLSKRIAIFQCHRPSYETDESTT